MWAHSRQFYAIVNRNGNVYIVMMMMVDVPELNSKAEKYFVYYIILNVSV